MTLGAFRNGEKITITGNIHTDVTVRDGRVQDVQITEDVDHVRSFWGHLGSLVNEADKAEEQDGEATGNGF